VTNPILNIAPPVGQVSSDVRHERRKTLGSFIVRKSLRGSMPPLLEEGLSDASATAAVGA